MSAIDGTSTRSIFLPGKNARETGKTGPAGLKRNTETRKNELETFAKSDSRVDIPDAIKDFSRIKKVADSAPDIDNTDKIARLKAQIQAGTYRVDEGELADKILEQEF